MLNADFKRFLKLVNGPYKEKINQMKTGRNGKAPYPEKINKHLLSGWCIQSTFSYGDILDPLKIYRGKDYVGKFVEQIKGEVKWLYVTFL